MPTQSSTLNSRLDPVWPAPNLLAALQIAGARPSEGAREAREDRSGWWREAHLVRRVAGGDSAALRELHDRYAPALLGFLRGRVGHSGQAEEVLQETFLQVWRDAERYDPSVASPRSWLFMLARSRALDCLRSSASRTRRERSFAREHDGPTGEPAGTANVEARERSLRVRRALRRLPEEQRQCLELAFWGELSHRQVAERLQQPLGTVKSRILLGLRKLRREMAA